MKAIGSHSVAFLDDIEEECTAAIEIYDLPLDPGTKAIMLARSIRYIRRLAKHLRAGVGDDSHPIPPPMTENDQ